MNKAWIIKYWTTETGKNEIEHYSRSLGKRLFELREKRFGYRMYYTFHGEQIIVLLVAGNKSTQKNDIRVARERMMKLKELGEYIL